MRDDLLILVGFLVVVCIIFTVLGIIADYLADRERSNQWREPWNR